MSTTAVLKCRFCNKMVTVPVLQTTKPDPDGSLLRELMRNLGTMAMCSFHFHQYNYYASQGKGQEYLEGKVF